jgi:hypothetical protein
LFGTLVKGEPDFEAVRPFWESELIQQALGLEGAAETVRIYAGNMKESKEIWLSLAQERRKGKRRFLYGFRHYAFTALKILC